MIAEIRQAALIPPDVRSRRDRTRERAGRVPRVIAFPSFERYDDEIRGWLSAIGKREPGTAPLTRVVQSIRRTLTEVERVRNSPRHTSLASFLRHAANAVEDREWDGARYILTTALAVSDCTGRAYQAPAREWETDLPMPVA